MYKRISYSIVGILLCTLGCCTTPQEKKVEFTCPSIEINNKYLKDAVIEYQKRIFKDHSEMIQHGDSIFIGVFGNQINDSITRYVISPTVVEYMDLKYNVPFAISHIDGHDVFITMLAGKSKYKKVCDFKMSEDDYKQLLKRYLPKKYREYQQYGIVNQVCMFEPENCYLTFIGDSLIDKTYKRGMISDGVWININGKKEYM